MWPQSAVTAGYSSRKEPFRGAASKIPGGEVGRKGCARAFRLAYNGVMS